MSKISIIYWSGTGNTEAMAKLIQEGVESSGAQVVFKSVDKATLDDVLSVDVCALGCPSMGDEILEDSEFRPFIDSILDKVSGRKLALFGSYGWGDGQWMRDWEQTMKQANAELVHEYLIVQEAPEGEDAESCRLYGRDIANV